MENIRHGHGTKSGIYKIINTVNGNFYIGSSIKIYYRLRRHLSDLRRGKHANPILTNAWNKYGKEAFTAEILEEVLEINLLEREEYYIKTLSPKYNCKTLELQRPVHSKAMKVKLSLATKKAILENRLTCGRKAIDVFDLKGNKISTHFSMKEVTKKYPVSHSSIDRVLKGIHAQNKGYIFRLAKDKVEAVFYNKPKKNMSKLHKVVRCENIITGEVELFPSLLALKARFGISVIHNIKYTVPYKKRYVFTYAT